MEGSLLKNMLGGIADPGRDLVKKPTWGRVVPAAKQPVSAAQSERIEGLCRALYRRGEASGVALASKVLDRYAMMSNEEKMDFFQVLAKDFGPDQQRLKHAWAAYEQSPDARASAGTA